MRAAPPWLSALWLSLSLAACGIKKPVGLADASAETADGAGSADVAETECVRAAVQLPWPARTASGGHPDLEVVAGSDAIAVLNRQATRLDVRTYGQGGTFLATASFPVDTQVLAAPGGGFSVVARTDDGGDLVQATFDSTLTTGTPDFAVTATATEHAMAAIGLATTTILVTDERFVNLATGTSAAWTVALDAAAAQTFKTGRVYGLAAQADKILLAWGGQSTLGLVAVDTSAHVLAHTLDDTFLGDLGAQTANAMPIAEGLLLFDGNPVRTTRIDFTLSRTELGRNQQLLTFSGTVPKVAGVMLGDQPIGVWLSVYPVSDNSQGSTPHQLYACALDLAAPQSCAGTSLIATTNLDGHDIAAQPVAAAALADGGTFAIVHTDANDRTWLRIADLRCQRSRD